MILIIARRVCVISFLLDFCGKYPIDINCEIMTDIIVYVPDIPLDVDQNVLENLIQTRVESLRVKTEGIKCYLQLGVAVIKLRNEADKTYLVKEVQSIVLKKDEGINISMVDEIELDSYIVIDKKLQKMPMTNEVAQRFAQAYSASPVHRCAVVSDQFPNVFRIFFKRFDELVQISNKPDFRISGGLATVYPRSDCNFFEDLPLHIDETNIRSALVQQIQEAQLVTRSFYIQHNKQTSTALIIAFKSVKRWEKEVYLTIDGQNIEKKSQTFLQSTCFTDSRRLQHRKDNSTQIVCESRCIP